MPAQLVANNASSTIATLGALSGTGTGTFVVASGHGTRFPSPTAGDYFFATLQDASNNIEIIQITGRSADTLTIGARGQESTTARAWIANDVVELRFTAGSTVTTAGTQTLTNKTIAGASNTVSVTNALTINNGGAGAASGSTYNGSAAVTLSYNTVGAPPAAHAVNASTYGYGDTTNAGHLRVGTGLSQSTGTVSLNLGNANSWTATQRADYNTAAVTTTSTYSFAGADQIVNISMSNAITVTFAAPSSLVTGAYYTFVLTAATAHVRTYAWNAAWKFPGAASPLTTGTSTSGAVDIITFIALSATTAAYVGHQADCR